MAGDEQFLSWELADVVAGKPPRDNRWRGRLGLEALKSGEGSINLPMLRLAIMLRAGTRTEQAEAIATWKELFQFFQGQWMGAELGSRIYGVWHVLAVASVEDWAINHRNTELANLANGWLLHWWCLLKLVEAPDGRLLFVGMRSGGHVPDPGILEWVYAIAMDGDVSRAETWCKESGAGLRNSWIYQASNALLGVLRMSAAPIRQGADPLVLIPHYGLIEPYHILKTEGGLAVWIEHNKNGNTTPVAGAVWTPHSLDWLPKDGGERIRQKFEQIDCRLENGRLVYNSDFQGHQETPLPGGVEVLRTTLPLGDELEVPVPLPPLSPSQPTSSTQPTQPSTAMLADFFVRLSALKLSRRDNIVRDVILGKLRNVGDVRTTQADISHYADIIAAFGIGPGQAQAADWQRLIADMKA